MSLFSSSHKVGQNAGPFFAAAAARKKKSVLADILCVIFLICHVFFREYIQTTTWVIRSCLSGNNTWQKVPFLYQNDDYGISFSSIFRRYSIVPKPGLVWGLNQQPILERQKGPVKHLLCAEEWDKQKISRDDDQEVEHHLIDISTFQEEQVVLLFRTRFCRKNWCCADCIFEASYWTDVGIFLLHSNAF